MARKQPTIPGIKSGSTPRGRLQRSVDSLAKQLRTGDDYDEHTAALVTLARATAASLDRLEADRDRSEHTIAQLAARHLDVLRELRPATQVADLFAELDAELDAALRDSPAT